MQKTQEKHGSSFSVVWAPFSQVQADYTKRPTHLVVSDLLHQRYGFPVILLCLAAEPGYEVRAYRNPGHNGPDVIHQVKVGLPRVTPPHALLNEKIPRKP